MHKRNRKLCGYLTANVLRHYRIRMNWNQISCIKVQTSETQPINEGTGKPENVENQSFSPLLTCYDCMREI